VLGTSGGYMGSDEFLTFIHNAEAGVKPQGMFEGRGPLMILLIVFLSILPGIISVGRALLERRRSAGEVAPVEE
jgi:hypothetical protein